MAVPTPPPGRDAARDLALFRTPGRWPLWPFLPLRRPLPGGRGLQLGVLYDARGVSGACGYSSTVFLANVLFLPRTEAGLLALPRCVYDTFDELAADGWVVD